MGEHFQHYYNNEELKKLVEKFGTSDKAELQKLIKAKTLNAENQTKNLDTQIK